MTDQHTIESVMEEDRRFDPPKEFSEKALVKSMESYQAIYDESIRIRRHTGRSRPTSSIGIPGGTMCSAGIRRRRGSSGTKAERRTSPTTAWTAMSGPRKNKAAIIWQGEKDEEVVTLTYQQLLNEVCKFANVLKSKGVQKGDRVSIYMPMVPELAIAMLATARIGAVHSIVFGGFSSESLRDRINDSECKLLITADGNHRGGKPVNLKVNADMALEKGGPVQSVIVVKRSGAEVEMEPGRDFWYHEEMAKASPFCEPTWMDAEDYLFILYTSVPPASPRAWCTALADICVVRADPQIRLRYSRRRHLLLHGGHRMGDGA